MHTDFHSPCSDEPEDIYDDSIALVDDLYEELVSESTDNTKAIFHCWEWGVCKMMKKEGIAVHGIELVSVDGKEKRDTVQNAEINEAL